MSTRYRSALLARCAAPLFIAVLALGVSPVLAHGQTTTSPTELKASRATLPLEHAVSTQHTATIKGQRVPYTATAGTLPVYDTEGNPVASVFYVDRKSVV